MGSAAIDCEPCYKLRMLELYRTDELADTRRSDEEIFSSTSEFGFAVQEISLLHAKACMAFR